MVHEGILEACGFTDTPGQRNRHIIVYIQTTKSRDNNSPHEHQDELALYV